MSDVQVRRDGAVLHLLLDRPTHRNALHLGMYADLVDALQQAAEAPDVHVVTLRGAGDHFTAGNDIRDFVEHPPLSEDHVIFRFLKALTTFPKPIVVGVDGAAVGVGTTLLLHCDVVVATARARLHLPFVPLGLTPEAASSVLLPATVGLARASRWLLLGEPFSGQEAYAAGIVTEIVDPDALADRVEALAHRLAALPPAAVQASKALLHGPRRELTLRALADEAEQFKARLRSPEAAAAFAAFLTKGSGRA